jgi:hypothetical protein
MAQTLRQALYLFSIGRFAETLDGFPVGDSEETSVAYAALNAALPKRRARGYTTDEFVAAAYDIVAGRYCARSPEQLLEATTSADARAAHAQDMTVLATARTFGLTTYAPPSTMGGLVTALGTLSQAQQLESALRLVAAGHLAPAKRAPYEIYGTTAQPYQITDAGRAALRAHEGLGELTVDRARGMHDSDLRSVWGGVELAVVQLARRQHGRQIVRGALLACGERHTGTGGWHVLPCVFDGRVGWVDSARGRAYLSTAELAPELVEALTVPEQPEGAVASGASFVPASVAQTSRVQQPAGWTQLLVDVRVDVQDAPAVEATDGVTAELVAWGLRSCYSEPGAPLGEWGTPEREADLPDGLLGEIRAHAQAGLDGIEQALLAQAGLPEEPGYRTFDDSCPWAVREVTTPSLDGSETWAALRASGIVRLAAAAGEYGSDVVIGARCLDRLAGTVALLLDRRLIPVDVALGPVGAAIQGSPLANASRRDVLRLAAKAISAQELRGAEERAQALDRELLALLTRDGAIITDAGVRLGVTAAPIPPKPAARPITLRDGTAAYHVPFGADVPDGVGHVVELGVDHEIRTRAEPSPEQIVHRLHH